MESSSRFSTPMGAVMHISIFDCNFEMEVNFRESRFSNTVYFSGTEFSGPVYFFNTKFSRGAHFVGAQFSSSAYFTRAKFFGFADFSQSKFFAKASFGGAHFNKGADFLLSQFFADSNFSESQFSKKAGFEMVQFSGWTEIVNVRFYAEANFSLCKFTDTSYFGGCNYHNLAFFNNATGFSNMYMEWEYDPEKFGPEKKEENKIQRGLKGHLQYNETFYIALIKNYRNMGWLREADDCYHTYRVEKRVHQINKLKKAIKGVEINPNAIIRLWNKVKLYGEWILLDLTFGYGVKPKKIF